MKHVIMVAMIEPYDEPVPEGTEVWGVNGAFRKQNPIHRVYFFDDPKYFPPGFADELNLLPDHVRVISTGPHEAIPRAEAFPLEAVSAYFNGIRYWVCTASYMIAHAIYEGFEKITLAGMYYDIDSSEYMHHKGCLEFWLGVAMGRGIEIDVHGRTALCGPFAWESPVYGYEVNSLRHLQYTTLGAAYKACYEFPRKFVKSNGDCIGPEPGKPIRMMGP